MIGCDRNMYGSKTNKPSPCSPHYSAELTDDNQNRDPPRLRVTFRVHGEVCWSEIELRPRGRIDIFFDVQC